MVYCRRHTPLAVPSMQPHSSQLRPADSSGPTADLQASAAFAKPAMAAARSPDIRPTLKDHQHQQHQQQHQQQECQQQSSRPQPPQSHVQQPSETLEAGAQPLATKQQITLSGAILRHSLRNRQEQQQAALPLDAYRHAKRRKAPSSKSGKLSDAQPPSTCHPGCSHDPAHHVQDCCSSRSDLVHHVRDPAAPDAAASVPPAGTLPLHMQPGRGTHPLQTWESQEGELGSAKGELGSEVGKPGRALERASHPSEQGKLGGGSRPSCSRSEPYNRNLRRGHREPDAIAAALAKREYVQRMPYLLRGPMRHHDVPRSHATICPPNSSKPACGSENQVSQLHQILSCWTMYRLVR